MRKKREEGGEMGCRIKKGNDSIGKEKRWKGRGRDNRKKRDER